MCRVCVLVTVATVALLAAGGLRAQQATRGLSVAPSYEGWEKNPDGSFNLLFGYFNRNWDESIDVSIGPANGIEPGGHDQGQPTHFLPRRNQFVFKVRVPKDFGNREIVWTLTSHGKTEKAYGTLKPDYVLSTAMIAANLGWNGAQGTSSDLDGNQAPVLAIAGSRKRQAKVGEPLLLTATATDDDRPPVRTIRAIDSNRYLPASATGLRLVWVKYRGSGDVTFDPPQFNAWQDTREGSNSPFAIGWKTPPIPPGNTWEVRATFRAPGEYVLRCIAHDGARWASEDVTMVVSP